MLITAPSPIVLPSEVKTPLLGSGTSSVDTLIRKIVQRILSALVSFHTTEDLSKQLYRATQLVLSTLFWTGYLISLGLFLGGYAKISFITAVLSTASCAGAYLAHQGAIQHSLAKSAEKLEAQNLLLEGHLGTLKEVNQDLREQIQSFKETNQKLEKHVEAFRKENRHLREAVHVLRREIASLHAEIHSLHQHVRELSSCEKRLKTQVSLFAHHNAQARSFAKKCKREMTQWIARNEAYTQSYGQLLERFTQQVDRNGQQQEEHLQKERLSLEEILTQLQRYTTALVQDQERLKAIPGEKAQAEQDLMRTRQEMLEAQKQYSAVREMIISAQQELITVNEAILRVKEEHSQVQSQMMRVQEECLIQRQKLADQKPPPDSKQQELVERQETAVHRLEALILQMQQATSVPHPSQSHTDPAPS